MKVIWQGPQQYTIGLIGVGLVTPGDELDLDDDLAENLIACGRAVPVPTPPKQKKITTTDTSGTATASSTETTE